MADEAKVGIFQRMARGLRATRQFLRARREIRRAAAPRSACEAKLAAAYEAISAAAVAAQVGTDLPAFADLVRCRRAADETQKALADREAALKSAQDELARESATQTAAIASAEAEHASASEAASKADGELKAAQSDAASAEEETRRTRSRLDTLRAAAESGETTEDVNWRLASLQERREGLATGLAKAEQAQRDSEAATKSKAEELRAADEAWQSTQAGCQYNLAMAQAMTTPDRDAAVQAAEACLEAETQKHAQVRAGLEAESQRLTEAAQADAAKVARIRQELAGVEGEIRSAQDILTARQLQGRLADLERSGAAAAARITELQPRADETRRAAEAKADQLRQASEAWQQAKTRCNGAVASALQARKEAHAAADATAAPLAEAMRRFGKEAFDRGLREGALATPSAQAAQHIGELAQIEVRLAGLRSEIDATRGAARTTAYVAGGVAILVVAAVAVILFFVFRGH